MSRFKMRPSRAPVSNRLLSDRAFNVEQLEVRNLMAVVSLGGVSTASAVALVDDRYEQNDSFSTAYNLGTLTTAKSLGGLVMADESDWYRFTTTKTGGTEAAVTIAFQNSQGNLDAALYNSSGTRLLNSAGTGNSEKLSLTSMAAGTYYVRVFGKGGVSNKSYSVTVNPTNVVVDDSYEENDTSATAKDLGTLTGATTVPSLIMADGSDWFKFTMTGTATSANSVKINFLQAQGNLDLELFNSSGTQVGTSKGTVDNESIPLTGLTAGTYTVHVLGANNPSYSLVINPAVSATPPSAAGFNITLVVTGMTASQQAAFTQAAAKWQSVITGDIPDATYNGIAVDDVLIDASGVPIDGVNGILGQATADVLRTGSFLPIHGIMQFDTADLTALEASGQLASVIVHEMGHVLGVGTIWPNKGLLTGAGTTNPTFTGAAQALAEYKSIFKITTATGVPVENTGGQGTADGHWRESIFGNELMTGYLNSGSNPLSRITVASMADLGYTVNLAAADAYTPPPPNAAVVTSQSRAASKLFLSVDSSPVGFASQLSSEVGPGVSSSVRRVADSGAKEPSVTDFLRFDRRLAIDAILRGNAASSAGDWGSASETASKDSAGEGDSLSADYDLSWLEIAHGDLAWNN